MGRRMGRVPREDEDEDEDDYDSIKIFDQVYPQQLRAHFSLQPNQLNYQLRDGRVQRIHS